MKMLKHLIKPALFIIAIFNICNNAVAQKVPGVQPGSVWMTSIKIDGKLGEWGENLQAYNKTTKVWYTLANDDKNVYLAIRATDNANINKILAGGISFALNTSGKKKDKDAYTITFPVIDKAAGRSGGRGRRGFGQQDTPDSAVILLQHKQALAAYKTISAIGFKQITDTLISIYNEYGIKAAATFDDKGNFTYELAIPLTMLNLTPGNQQSIAYNIKLNGMQMGGGGGFGGRNGGGGYGGGGGRGSSGGGGLGFGGRDDSDANDLTSPTDFWGKYILATSANPPNK